MHNFIGYIYSKVTFQTVFALRNSKDVEGHETQCVTPERLDKQCSPVSHATTPQCSSPVSVNPDATQKVHLFSPQEFLPHSSCPKESEEELGMANCIVWPNCQSAHSCK